MKNTNQLFNTFPATSRRNDGQCACHAKFQQLSITRHKIIHLGLQGTSNNPRVFNIANRQTGRCGLRWNDLQQTQLGLDLHQQWRRSTKLALQNIQYLKHHRLADNDFMLSQQALIQISTQATCGQRADQHIGIKKQPHEMALNTSSSVKNPAASASGMTSPRTARNLAKANWRRKASRTMSPLGRCEIFAANDNSRSNASSRRILKVALMETSELNVLHCSTFNHKFKVTMVCDNDWRIAA